MTNITRWDPFNLHAQLDDVFTSLLSTNLSRDTQGTSTMDVYSDNDKEIVAELHAPGFDKDDIEIKVHNGVLEIKGEKHEKDEDKKKRSYMMRESHASFYRSIALPTTAQGDKVKAAFDNGVLKVIVPLKELPAPKKIAIEGGKKK